MSARDHFLKGGRSNALVDEDDAKLEAKVFADKIKLLQKNLFFSVIASLLCSFLVITALLPVSSFNEVMLWFSGMVLVSLFRLGTLFYYHAKPIDDKKYLKLFIIGVILNSALWGVAGSYLMPPFYYLQQMLVIIVICGVTAGAVQTLQAYVYAAWIYLFCSLVPLISWIFLQPAATYLILGLAIGAYLAFMLVAGLRGSATIDNALRLKYQNVKLIANLTNINHLLLSVMHHIKSHENQLMLINQLNDLLQTSRRSNEAYEIVSSMGKKLFSNMNGALAIYNEPIKSLVTVMQWGAYQNMKSEFKIEDCWALRSGHVYTLNKKLLPCKHFLSKSPRNYICLPLIAQNEMIGIVHLNDVEPILPEIEQVATTFSEVIKLSLNNIKLHEELAEQAIHDALTGLYNRRYLDERLAYELERFRMNDTLSIAMLDIDHFKKINDQYGHEAGDEVLRWIGRLLQEQIRGTDIACRYGGEEFLVILRNSNAEGAAIKLKTICDLIRQQKIIFQNLTLPQITVSAGIATAPLHGTRAHELVGSADLALYEAKNNGRDRVEIYHKKCEVMSVEGPVKP